MNLPNILTIARILLTFGFIHYIFLPGFSAKALAGACFFVAGLTDYYDGYLARRYKLITNFGKIMDPIADKFLTLTCFYVFTVMAIIPFWMFAIIFVREVYVTLVRFLAMKTGRVLAAENIGKLKTLSQLFAIALTLTFLVYLETSGSALWSASTHGLWNFAIMAFTLLAVLLTLISGVSFLLNNRKLSNET